MVWVLFDEALDYDQGDDGQGEERLGDSFSGGGFHYGGQPLINRFPCQQLMRSFFGKPNVFGLEIGVQKRMSMSCQRWKIRCPRWTEGH